MAIVIEMKWYSKLVGSATAIADSSSRAIRACFQRSNFKELPGFD